jgi:uncharacterized protein DUF5615
VKVLFDQNTPRPLARFLAGHEVFRAAELGWQQLSNGELISSAEAHGFDVLITADRNLRYQQNLAGRKLAIIVLPSGRWPEVKPYISAIIQTIQSARPGGYVEIAPSLSR